MISPQLEVLLNKAIQRANKYKYEFLTIENVLLSLLDDETVSDVLVECGADLITLKKDLEELLAILEHQLAVRDDKLTVLG